MHFGRVASLKGVDFNIPLNAAQTRVLLELGWKAKGRI